jgi:hypothetical protein
MYVHGRGFYVCLHDLEASHGRLGAGGNLSYQIDSWLRMIYMDLNVFLLSVRYKAVLAAIKTLVCTGQVKVRSFIWVTMRA